MKTEQTSLLSSNLLYVTSKLKPPVISHFGWCVCLIQEHVWQENQVTQHKRSPLILSVAFDPQVMVFLSGCSFVVIMWCEVLNFGWKLKNAGFFSLLIYRQALQGRWWMLTPELRFVFPALLKRHHVEPLSHSLTFRHVIAGKAGITH